MCEFIITQVVSAIVGLLTGAIVSVVFYFIGRRDATSARLQAHLSSLAFALERCDPTHNAAGRRGDDGLEPTTHMVGCMIRVLERDGFQATADDLRPISEEMEDLVRTFDHFDEAHKKSKKSEWQATLAAIIKRYS